MKIVIDNKIPFIEGAFDKLADVVYLQGNEIGPMEVKDADAMVVRTRTACNASLLKGSALRFIATATIGYDHIDTEFCKQAGIEWTNAPGCNSSSVEQYIVSALLYLAKRKGIDLHSCTIGIIGVGNVGSKVARAASVLGCRVLLNDPPREREEGKGEFMPLQELLAASDIVSIHVPLTYSGQDNTIEMVNKEFLSGMKKGSHFINTSRGEVVNEHDLKNAMKTGQLSSVILDVFKNEPVIDRELAGMLTLATPHIAGYSTDGKANGTAMSVRALSRFFKLGLDEWIPEGVPEPAEVEIPVDGSGEELEVLSEVYNHTYSIREDHNNLIKNIPNFEKLRGTYRLRREASAYRVRVFNDDGKYRALLEGLGFSVLGDSCY